MLCYAALGKTVCLCSGRCVSARRTVASVLVMILLPIMLCGVLFCFKKTLQILTMSMLVEVES